MLLIALELASRLFRSLDIPGVPLLELRVCQALAQPSLQDSFNSALLQESLKVAQRSFRVRMEVAWPLLHRHSLFAGEASQTARMLRSRQMATCTPTSQAHQDREHKQAADDCLVLEVLTLLGLQANWMVGSRLAQRTAPVRAQPSHPTLILARWEAAVLLLGKEMAPVSSMTRQVACLAACLAGRRALGSQASSSSSSSLAGEHPMVPALGGPSAAAAGLSLRLATTLTSRGTGKRACWPSWRSISRKLVARP